MAARFSERLIEASPFIAFLMMACVADLRARRVPNVLVAIMAVSGGVYAVLTDPVLAGLQRAGGGLLLGLAIWLPAWLLGWMGAGDVKLFAASGTWLGPRATLEAAIIAALAGGVLSLGWMVWRRGVGGASFDLWSVAAHPLRRREPGAPLGWGEVGGGGARSDRMPYTLALAAGLATAALFPRLLL